jgi:hypothetical protein
VTVVLHPRRATDRACECLHLERVTAHAVSHLLGDLPLTDSCQFHKPSRGQTSPRHWCVSVRLEPAPPQATPPTRSARTGPPTDTAKLLRQSESVNQRAPTPGDRLTRSVTCRSSDRSVPISRGPNPHRHRPTPPTRSAKPVRQLTPPSCSASQRAPTRERRLPVSIPPDRHPAGPRIEACRSVAAQTRTATGDTAKPVRQLTPPSCSASQRAPTVSDQLTPPVTCRSSHRSVLISRGSIPHRRRRHRQRGPPSRSAN